MGPFLHSAAYIMMLIYSPSQQAVVALRRPALQTSTFNGQKVALYFGRVHWGPNEEQVIEQPMPIGILPSIS